MSMEGRYNILFETAFPRTRSTNNTVVSDKPSELSSNPQKEQSVSGTQDVKKKHVNHMLRNSGIVAGAGVAIIAPVVFLAMKGKLPSPITKSLLKFTDKVSQQVERLREKPHISRVENFYLSCLQKVSKVGNKLRGFIFNAGPLKDVLAEKTMKKVGFRKVCDKITGFFENVAFKMTFSDYQKSRTSFATMQDAFVSVNSKMANSAQRSKVVKINGVAKTVEEWAQVASDKLTKMGQDYKSFDIPSVEARGKKIAERFDGLGDKVFDQTYGRIGGFLTEPKKWTSFITEDIVASDKMKYRAAVMRHKRQITNNPKDTKNELERLLADAMDGLEMSDTNTANAYKRLKKLIDSYNPTDMMGDSGYKNQLIVKIAALGKKTGKDFSDLIKVVERSKNGEMENILEIYRAILPEREFQAVNKVAQKAKVSLETAVVTETDKFVDKLRDLKSGSAVSDVGQSLLIPVVSTGVGMAMADTKEKKRSVLINLGIPLVVGVATSVAATLAMLTAGPSLLLSLATTFLTNRVCERIDKNIKKNEQAKSTQLS